ncbi:MAG: carboxypeptidase-like regulatory domain-containing protein [Pyrinomonadaceae bacterium]
MKQILISAVAVIALFVAAQTPGDAHIRASGKTSSFKGKIFLGDKTHSIADAEIMLMDDKKSDKQNNTVETKTDAEGNFSFASVAEGKYTVSIRSWYNTQEEAPCQFLVAKTKDKESSVIVMKDKDKFVQQIFINNFTVKGGKEIVRDFDIVCHSMFGG